MLEVKEKLTWGEKVSFVLQLEAKAKKKEKKKKRGWGHSGLALHGSRR